MLKCPGCGTDVLVRMQLTANPKGTALICRGCGHWYLGYSGRPESCEFCGSNDFVERESNRPACPECTRHMFQADDEVRMGGVYWNCDGCGSEGYLERTHPVALGLRLELDCHPPERLLLKLGKCPYCHTRPPIERKVGGAKLDFIRIDDINNLPPH